MTRQEEPVWKPSIEFYVDKKMGLCLAETNREGSESTAQYLNVAKARQEFEGWLAKWVKE